MDSRNYDIDIFGDIIILIRQNFFLIMNQQCASVVFLSKWDFFPKYSEYFLTDCYFTLS